MRLGYSLTLEQTQKLIMTPELRQAITILQLPVLELAEYIEQEMLENPLLETKEEREDETVEAPEKETPEKETDIDWQEYFQDKSDTGIVRAQREQASEYSYENFLAQTPTLQEYLTQQLTMVAKSSDDELIGEYLIGNIDDNGYLTVDLAEVTQSTGYDLEQVSSVLGMVQGLEPAGVGSRNLQECLLIQLNQLQDVPAKARDLIKNHLPDLAAGKITKISASLEISPREVQELGDFLRTLDPKPGRRFSSNKDTRYVVPDVVVEKVNGEYIVLVNDTSVPRLGINKGYRDVLIKQGDEEAKKFIEAKLHSAVSLVKSIEQRRLTLYKVVNCIINLQRDFFDRGIRYLKPMTLRQVAEIVHLHESTVSRATSGKFMQAPQGVFELKFFFASGVENSTGDSTSSESIKKQLKDILQTEEPGNPLSDQKLADILNNGGINISRRTVAKYRDELGIPATNLRKRY
jgi:RNA polymerase sigma-54 factor